MIVQSVWRLSESSLVMESASNSSSFPEMRPASARPTIVSALPFTTVIALERIDKMLTGSSIAHVAIEGTSPMPGTPP